jgi:aspartyl-tRNA synthetase
MFYALPQSPQLFKQILMVAGYERYFQIAKCFRDEDLRNDRQPEFTQVDIEMSFITIDMIIDVIECLIKNLVKEILGRDIEPPFGRISYDEAMARYGKDAPDTRFAIELDDCADIFKTSEFKIFTAALSDGGIIKGIAVADDGKFSRKTLDDYTEYVKQYKSKGLPWVRFKGGSFEGGISKFLSEQEKAGLINKFGLKGNEVIMLACGRKEIVNASLGNLRIKIAHDLNLVDGNALNFLWVTDFPLLEYNEEDNRFYSVHHPFTSPLADHIKLLDDITPQNVDKIKSQAYDIVLNGIEIGGGSIRINVSELQNKIFSILGISPEDAAVKFSFLLEALQYGAPPHGGIALGLDRIMMLFLKRNSIRDVIAFPKTTRGQCLMSGAPSPVSAEQLNELSLNIFNDKYK